MFKTSLLPFQREAVIECPSGYLKCPALHLGDHGQGLCFYSGVEHSRKSEGTTVRTQQESLCFGEGGEGSECGQRRQRREQPLTMALWTSLFWKLLATFLSQELVQQQDWHCPYLDFQEAASGQWANSQLLKGARLEEKWSKL